MSSGVVLGLVALGLFVGWLVVDVVVWFMGKETFSQWVIKKAKEDQINAILIGAIIALSSAFLTVHFEIPEGVSDGAITLSGSSCKSWECKSCSCIDNPTPPPFDCEGPLSFTGGTLWKPKGDHTGKLVVLLAEQHDYDRCEVKRRDGSWEGLQYTGRSNGNRQTWRGNFPGGPAYAGRKLEGGVRCDSSCFFPIPGAPKRRWE